MIKKCMQWGIIAGIMAGITTCSTYKRASIIETDFDTGRIAYPLSDVPVPQTDLFIELPTPAEEIFRTERRMVTMRFSAFEKANVRAKDPLLFASGNTIIVDLKNLSESEHAFPLPGSKVISAYGGRRKGHSGVDLKTHANDTIVSAFDGIVRMSAPYAAYGNVIVVRHYNGLETVYSHNSRNLVKPGDTLRAGQAIALTGRTGRATTEHLHFEVRINGEAIDPALFYDLEQGSLRKECFLCTRKGQKITVAAVNRFPYQNQYLSTYY